MSFISEIQNNMVTKPGTTFIVEKIKKDAEDYIKGEVTRGQRSAEWVYLYSEGDVYCSDIRSLEQFKKPGLYRWSDFAKRNRNGEEQIKLYGVDKEKLLHKLYSWSNFASISSNEREQIKLYGVDEEKLVHTVEQILISMGCRYAKMTINKIKPKSSKEPYSEDTILVSFSAEW